METVVREQPEVRRASSTATPDLSVVIVSYEVRDLLDACLASLPAGAGKLRLEVIVVDNGSTDGSASWVREHHPWCAVVEAGENLGFSRATNLGLRRAKGKYLLLLNPDTVVFPRALEKTAAFLDAHPDVGMVTCRLVTRDGRLDPACRRSFPSLWDGFCRASGLSRGFPRSRLFNRYNLGNLDEHETCDVEAVNGAFMLVRREAVEEVGLLDEGYFMYVEDLDWCLRFRRAGWRIVYYPGAEVKHLKGRSGAKHSGAMIRCLFASTLRFYRRHYFPHRSLPWRLAVAAGLQAWMGVTLLRNTLRREKRSRP